MRTIFVVSFILLALGCRNPTDNYLNRIDGNYYKSLLEQNLYLVNDTILISLDNGKVTISKKRPFVPNSRIMFHEINTNGTFTNKDFNSTVLKPDSSQIKNGQTIFYGSNNIDVSPNTKIRIGEYYRSDNLQPIDIWSTEFVYLPVKHYDNIKRASKFLGINPKIPYMNYVKNNGVFFKTSGELYLWIIDDTIFFIRKKIPGNKNKVMFHILMGNTFMNLDFDFSTNLSNKLLLSSSFEIAELKTSKDIFSYNIRIGEYVVEHSKNKNLWAQQIDMSKVKNNELLKFHGDIEEIQAQ
jgi:hypothetical protein